MGLLYDAYDQWLRHENKQNKLLEQQPVCADCQEHIQHDHYYRLPSGEIICPDCMESNYRVENDDFFD